MVKIDEKELQRIVEEILLKHHFEFPVYWVMVGVNGALFAGKFEISISGNGSSCGATFRTVTVSGKVKNLHFPINMMLVDKTGKSALTSFRLPDRPKEATKATPRDETDRFLSKLQETIGGVLDLKKKVDDGSISPEEAIKKVEALNQAVEEERKKIGLPGEDPEKHIPKKGIFN